METLTNSPAAAHWRRGAVALEESHRIEALAAFEEGWELAETPLEKVVGAHLLARAQPDARSALTWDHRALENATAIEGSKALLIRLPSLYAGCADTYARLGDSEGAVAMYRAAGEVLDAVDEPQPGDQWWALRETVYNGLTELGDRPRGYSLPLEGLAVSLAERGADDILEPIRVAIICNSGSDFSVARLVDTLDDVTAASASELLEDELILAHDASQAARESLMGSSADVSEVDDEAAEGSVDVGLRL